MNETGKFKKATVIILIIAVVLSVISLGWVLIFKGDDQYVQTNKEFYEETSATNKIQAVDNNKSDADEMFNVEISVPVSFILENINKNSQLTDKQKDAGFKSASFDGESTVTYSISKANHRKFLLSYKYEITESMESTLKTTYPCFKELDYNDNLSHITIKVDSSAYDPADIESMASAVLLPSMIYRLYALEEAECTVYIADSQTGSIITSYTP